MKDEKETYNGWSNYETWCVNLWLTNEEVSSRELAAIVRDSKDLGLASQTIKEWVEEMLPDLGATFAADLLGAAVGAVNWYEIAENHKEDEP
jgi:hypothetical protein